MPAARAATQEQKRRLAAARSTLTHTSSLSLFRAHRHYNGKVVIVWGVGQADATTAALAAKYGGTAVSRDSDLLIDILPAMCYARAPLSEARVALSGGRRWVGVGA